MIYLADFLRTNLTRFSVIRVKKHQKASFVNPRSSKIIVTKEKEERKRKSEEKERRRREKSNGCTLSFYKQLLWGQFLAEKTPELNCSTQKVHWAITFSKKYGQIYKAVSMDSIVTKKDLKLFNRYLLSCLHEDRSSLRLGAQMGLTDYKILLPCKDLNCTVWRRSCRRQPASKSSR